MSTMTIFLYQNKLEIWDRCDVILSDDHQPKGMYPRLVRVKGGDISLLKDIINKAIDQFKKNLPAGASPMSPVTLISRYTFGNNGKVAIRSFQPIHLISQKPA
jgi:hypothetical protein